MAEPTEDHRSVEGEKRMHYICVKLIWSLCPALPFFRTVIRNTPTKRQVKIVPSCTPEIFSLDGAFLFLVFLAHLSLSLSLFLTLAALLLVLSGSQWRYRRSSFGSTRLRANVPISEGRVRTTNHRRRGRGERLWPRGSLLRLRVLSQTPLCTEWQRACFSSTLDVQLLSSSLESSSLFASFSSSAES